MENTFFYTFSTVAQTLAGAIGLLAAFVLFRLQSLNAEIESIGERLAGWVEQVSQQAPQQTVGLKARRLHARGEHTELLTIANRIEVPTGFYQAAVERERLPHLLAGKASLVRHFGLALCLTVGLVTVSVLLLTVTPRVAASPWACWVLAAAAIWFTGCMLSYVALLWKVFR
jgi:hypothetical protein